MQNKKLLQYSLLSGILLSTAWIPGFTGLFLLVGFIPLLIVEHQLYLNRKENRAGGYIKYLLIAFATWNILTSWWLKNASFVGLIVAVIINTSLFTFVFWLFHFTKRKTSPSFGVFSLIVYWITFEHFYLNAEITWPWLTLGYGFAEDIKLIQWYEHTGALGGSLWILLSNATVFTIVKKWFFDQGEKNWNIREFIIPVVVVFVPMIISVIRFYNYEEKEDPREIVVVQPNIDPYEKFVAVDPMDVTMMLITLADSLATENTDYVVAPETVLYSNIWLNQIMNSRELKYLKQFVDQYPKMKYVLGIWSRKRYETKETETARPYRNGEFYYDTFNSAIQLDQTDSVQIYHKSQLVTGVEKMPYQRYLGFLENLTLKLGGTFRSHGTQKERANLISPNDGTSISPVICWESVFGEYVTNYVKKGSDFIFVITNDGWWGDTPGHKHHNSYSQIRAIENRRSIARSANTGISSFINQRGEILQQLDWWERGAIKQNLNANRELTFYTKHGDYLARIARFFSLLCVLYFISQSIMQRKK